MTNESKAMAAKLGDVWTNSDAVIRGKSIVYCINRGWTEADTERVMQVMLFEITNRTTTNLTTGETTNFSNSYVTIRCAARLLRSLGMSRLTERDVLMLTIGAGMSEVFDMGENEYDELMDCYEKNLKDKNIWG